MLDRPRPPVRVVIVTLDNHLAGAVERAEARFLGEGQGITIGLHAAADWERDPAALDRAKADVARGDIVIVTMMFLEDHIRAILPTLQARREQCDAMLCLMSASEVVRLTRLGAYRMDAPTTGPLALLKRLRGSSKPGGNSGAGQMKMLRRLPKLLKYIPGTAQDVRAYFLTLQYWLAGSDDNVVQMVRALIDRYADGPRSILKGKTKAEAPREYPDVGVYHPHMPGRLSANAADLPAGGKAGTVGLLLLRSYLLGRDSAHYDGVIAALESRGLRVVPAFASGLDSRPAIEKFFMARGRATVDVVISLTGFSLVGGPAYNDSAAAVEALQAIGVPYVAAHPVEFQMLQEWGTRFQGLLPLEATMMVAIPELDGAISPMVFGGRAAASSEPCKGCERGCVFQSHGLEREMRSCPDRAEMLSDRVLKMVTLRRRARAERKLGIVLFNFPPNAGATGTAACLAVWESLHATLVRLAAEGYAADVPETVDTLRDTVLQGNSARYGADANVAARIPADDHVRREKWLNEIEASWGPAPGKFQSDGGHIQVLGAHFGNVFVGIQPATGVEGDPMRLLFEGRYTPTHAMSAFYRWMREDFGADAVLHFGTHGALEFLPGKQTGMSGACWPDRLIGDLPNFYLYCANNPSEGMIAKRRTGATIISYLTPPLAQAGLYKGLSELKTLLERWRATPPEAEERPDLERMIRESAEAVDLDPGELDTLAGRLYEFERELIPHGLRVLGAPPSHEERQGYLDAIAGASPDADLAAIGAALDASDELGALIHALDGGYIAPAPGGHIIHNPDVLPVGRNVCGLDPFRLPTRFAVAQGVAAADQVIARHVSTGAPFPRSIAIVLWGTDNLKSEGAQIAQALAFIGARPRHDSYGRLVGAELIPLAELGRPRIDVVVTLSGIFRDLLPLQTRMLAEAAWLAALADEPEAMNPIRAHSLRHAAKHGIDLETAALRVFSNAEGAYGANVNLMIDGSAWEDPSELADSFEKQKGYAYGRSGAPVQRRELMTSTLADVDLTYQNLESVEIGVTDLDQYVDALGGISRSIARAKGGDAPPVYIVDATQGHAKVRSLAEQVELETRTRTLNPKWYEGQLRHGFEGVRAIEAHVTTTMGWSATTGEVKPWVYQQISETFVLDPEMRHRLSRLNPKASARVANRLLEACDRNLWQPDAATLAALRDASHDLEDRLEGLVPAE